MALSPSFVRWCNRLAAEVSNVEGRKLEIERWPALECSDAIVCRWLADE
jgi:hypothetical protein